MKLIFQQHPSWLEQFDRMQRWHEKLLAADVANASENEVLDLMLVCLQNMYYLKDWVQDAVEETPHKKEVKKLLADAFKSGDDVYLSLIRDLCNSSKHKKLYSNRNQQVWVERSGEAYVIRTKKIEVPVLVVTRYGEEWWKRFLGIQ